MNLDVDSGRRKSQIMPPLINLKMKVKINDIHKEHFSSEVQRRIKLVKDSLTSNLSQLLSLPQP
jgi:hypothetical protein